MILILFSKNWKGSLFLLLLRSREKISIAPGAVENYRALISEALIRKDRDKRRKFLSKLSLLSLSLRFGIPLGR